MKRIIIITMIIAVTAAHVAQSQIPQTMSYQGVLTDGGGTPVADGTYNITFRLYDAAGGGSALWTETQAVAVTGGIFSAILGSTTPLGIAFDRPYWLGVSVDGGAELSPRRALTSSPYSLNANGIADSTVTSGKIKSGTAVRSLNGLRDDVTLEGGNNINLSISADTIRIDATGVGTGDITGVIAGNGLQGGGGTGDVTLDVGSGVGVSVTPTSVGLDTVYTDGRFVNAGETDAVNTSMLQDSAVTEAKLKSASVTGEKIASGAAVKSLNGLADDVTLAAGANVTITSSNDSLIIASSGGGTGGNTLDQAYDQGGPGAGRFITADAGAVRVAGNDGLTVDGPVGVGTSSPVEMLDVFGGIGCTSFKLSTNPQSGHVLTSDGFGIGSWQALPDAGWSLTGNAGLTPGVNFLGTTDNTSLEVKANSLRILLLQPHSLSPNLIGGFATNFVNASAYGATISGGGSTGKENKAHDVYGVVGGGHGNEAGLDNANFLDEGWATVAGGEDNLAQGKYSAIGGGQANQAPGWNSVVGGGSNNQANQNFATVSGGDGNIANGNWSTIGGGDQNRSSNNSTTVAGGTDNRASGTQSTVGGGVSNNSSAEKSTIGGGSGNTASQRAVTVSGGEQNSATAVYSTIGGGQNNSVTANYGTISGGGRGSAGDPATANRVTDRYGTVGGGGNNQAGDDAGTSSDAPNATVAGGLNNIAGGRQSTVGGGWTNSATGQEATVSGGAVNLATAGGATVGGGSGNTAGGIASAVGGGASNTASGSRGTIAGGESNEALDLYSTVGGGGSNTAGAASSTVSGGSNNTAGGAFSTVSGGELNQANLSHATIVGGSNNTADNDYATVLGGYQNTASGDYAVTVGGENNEAAGLASFAAGTRAKVAASHNGAFLFADSLQKDFLSAASNEFAVRATGGVRLVTAVDLFGAPTAGATLAPGAGSWGTISDRNAKENIAPTDGENVLERLAAIEISTWNYKTQDHSIRHMGPMAQEFYAAFGLGEDEKRINTVDADGVALAAIQGLNLKLQRKLEEKDRQIGQLESRVAELERLMKAMLATADANKVAASSKEVGQ